MSFQADFKRLTGRLLAVRAKALRTRCMGMGWAHACWLLFSRQHRYVIWSTATYVTLLLEIILLQYQYGVFIGGASLHILRILSIFSLLPILTLYCMDVGEIRQVFPETPPGKERQRTKLSRLTVTAKGLFALKLLLSLIIVDAAFYSPSFTLGAPLMLQAIILARVIAGPWESTAGFLLLSRHGRFILTGSFFSRSATILADLAGLLFIVGNMPLLYFCWHVGFRIIRSRWFFGQVLSISWTNMLVWTKAEGRELLEILRAIGSSLCPLLLAWVIAEVAFFRLSVVLMEFDSQAGLVLLLAHSQYHLGLAITFRALRGKLSYLGNILYAADLASKIKEASSLCKVGIVAALISCPTAAAGLIPYLNQTWLSPVGEMLTLDNLLIVGTVCSGLAHILSGTALLASVHLATAKKYLSLWCLIAIVAFEAFLFPSNLWRGAVANPLESIGRGLLVDALLHSVYAALLLCMLVRTKMKAFPKRNSQLLAAFYGHLAQGSFQGYQAVSFRWKKGIIGRKFIVGRLASAIGIELAEIALSQDRMLCVFSDSQDNGATVRRSIAPYAERMRAYHPFTAVEMVACVKEEENFGGTSLSEHIEKEIVSYGGMPLQEIKDTELLLLLGKYSRHLHEYGIFAPPPADPKLSHITHTVKGTALAKVFILKKGTPGWVRKQFWIDNFEKLAGGQPV